MITTLRDSQNYVRASETGTGIFEMKPYLVREDTEQWLPLVGWLAQRPPVVESTSMFGTGNAGAHAVHNPAVTGAQPQPVLPQLEEAESTAYG